MGNPFEKWLDEHEPAEFARKLKLWFRRNGRDLPWRNEPSAYRVWVSEIMLQQTQVETVREYFLRFMDRFPNIEALAAARIDEVLRMWEGLGYYRRARSLHTAAQKVVQDFEGHIPKDPVAIGALPGIGRYTAGAILSIAHQQRQPILEGNTIRLHSRLAGSRLDVGLGKTQKSLWIFAEAILPSRRPGDFNQALMDLGSMVCRVRNPECGKCPVSSFCEANRQGNQLMIPVKTVGAKIEPIHQVAIVVSRKDKVLMRQCPEDQWWTGLWDFPRLTVPDEFDDNRSGTRFRLAGYLAEWLKEQSGLDVGLDDTGWELRHAVTRYRIRLSCYQSNVTSGRLIRGSAWRWVALREIEELPLSATGRRLVAKLRKQSD